MTGITYRKLVLTKLDELKEKIYISESIMNKDGDANIETCRRSGCSVIETIDYLRDIDSTGKYGASNKF